MLKQEVGSAFELLAGEIDEERHVVGMFAVVVRQRLSGVVGGDDEESVFEPGLLTCGGKKLAQGMVYISDSFQQGNLALRELSFILFGNGIGMVGGDGVDSREEGLVKL